jgi:hypothetical protein
MIEVENDPQILLSSNTQERAHLCNKEKNGPLQSSPPHSAPGREGLRINPQILIVYMLYIYRA